MQSSTLIKRMNSGENPSTVPRQELPRWNKSKGQLSQGLVNRRHAEVNLFTRGSSAPGNCCNVETVVAVEVAVIAEGGVEEVVNGGGGNSGGGYGNLGYGNSGYGNSGYGNSGNGGYSGYLRGPSGGYGKSGGYSNSGEYGNSGGYSNSGGYGDCGGYGNSRGYGNSGGYSGGGNSGGGYSGGGYSGGGYSGGKTLEFFSLLRHCCDCMQCPSPPFSSSIPRTILIYAQLTTIPGYGGYYRKAAVQAASANGTESAKVHARKATPMISTDTDAGGVATPPPSSTLDDGAGSGATASANSTFVTVATQAAA